MHLKKLDSKFFIYKIINLKSSTASMGKFDWKVKDEPKTNPLHTGNKQKVKNNYFFN